MKIAFSTSGETLDSPLDARFGRAPKFLVYDLDSETFEVVDNRQNLNAAQGAGIQSAETVARLGVNILVTGHCGPKAFRVLRAAGIKDLHHRRAHRGRGPGAISLRKADRGQGRRRGWALGVNANGRSRRAPDSCRTAGWDSRPGAIKRQVFEFRSMF